MTIFQKITILLLFTVIFNAEALATGPSYLRAEMKPVSINEKGDILCRTRFLKNPSGGHYIEDIEYGVCVLTNDTIVQYITHVLSFAGYPDYEGYGKHRTYWDSIFQTAFESKNLSEIEYSVAHNYKFNESNVSQFERNNTISFGKLEKEKKIKLQKASQISLYGGNGYCAEGDTINVLYDFGNIIIVNNENRDECGGEDGDTDLGVIFDYPNYWGEEDIGYDCQKITGVLFLQSQKK